MVPSAVGSGRLQRPKVLCQGVAEVKGAARSLGRTEDLMRLMELGGRDGTCIGVERSESTSMNNRTPNRARLSARPTPAPTP